MEKAYDVKALVEMMKESGLEIVEEEAKKVYEALKKWLQESAKLSETPYDDLAMPFLKQLDPLVLPQLEKINPADNE